MSPQKTKSFIRGTQIFSYNLAMFVQGMKRVGLWGLLIYVGIFFGLMYLMTSKADVNTFAMHYWSSLLDAVGNGSKIVAGNPLRGNQITAAEVLKSPIDQAYFKAAASRFITHSIVSAIIGGILYFVAMSFFVRAFIRKGNKSSFDQILSGTFLAKNIKETIKSVTTPGNVFIAGVLPMPQYSETQGIMVHGSVGTGKSQMIMHLLDNIRARGDIAIVYDKECTLKPYFFNEKTDKELNPLSASCENWDIWQECKTPIEMSALATYLMPKAVQGSDPFWVDAARTIFATVAWKMRHDPDRNIIKLLQVLLTTSLDELRGILTGTEAENLVSKDIEKTAISIRAVMATYTKSLRFMEGLNQTGTPFAIKDWITEQLNNKADKKGWLFVSSRANFHAEIKPLISAWLGMSLKAVQSLTPNPNRRIWIVMDETASLNRLENLSDIAADIRKFGGCVALGIQSISQLHFIYGRDEATAITDLQNTGIYFRSPRQRVAEWVSQDLGEQVIEEVRESQSYGPNSIRDGNTISRQRVTRRTVDTGTIMNLENLHCYVRLAGNHPITQLSLAYQERKILLAEALVERTIDYDAIEKITVKATQAELNPSRDDGVKIEQKANIANGLVATKANLAEPEKAKELEHHIELNEASINTQEKTI